MADNTGSGNARTIYLLGFPPEELEQVPANLDVQPIDSLDTHGWPPPDSLLVVHSNAAQDYQSAVDSLAQPASGQPSTAGAVAVAPEQVNRAVLYLATKGEFPQVDWEYFGGAVNPRDWRKLRQLARCPWQLQTTPLAHQVPLDDLEDAKSLIESSALSSGALASMSLPTDTPQEVRGHLETCEICRSEFLSVLNDRLRSMYLMRHPSAERLGEYIFEPSRAGDAWVQTHLATCASCAAIADVLREISAPLEPAPAVSVLMPAAREPLLSVALRTASDQIQRLADRALTYAEVAATFLQGLVQPAGGLRLATPGVGDLLDQVLDGEISLSDLFDPGQLESHASYSLVGGGIELDVHWLPEEAKLVIDEVYDENVDLVDDFTLQFTANGEPLWSGTSDGGALTILVTELESALRAGADRLVMLINGD